MPDPEVTLFSTAYTTPNASEIQRARERYLKSLLDGDDQGAADVIHDGVVEGWGPATLYLDVMAAAMVAIGDMWHSGEITVAHEHQASLITSRQMAVLRDEFHKVESTGLKAIVGTVERDGHLLGAMIFADFLSFNGWEVHFLGAGVPSGDLSKLVDERKPDLVVLTATLHEGVGLVVACVHALKALQTTPKIVVGGPAVKEFTGEIERIEADLVAADILEGLAAVQLMFGFGGESVPLDVILHRVGENVRSLRIARGWSQQQLADSAGLDRTYLSGVEHGRQNLTLGALKKFADALGSPITKLISA